MVLNSKEFKEKYINFFNYEKNQELHYTMYAFGLSMFSYHNRSNEIDYNPVNKMANKTWSPSLLRRIKWGAEDNDNIDENFKEYSLKFDKITEAIDTSEYLIKRAIDLNRPDWGIFYLLGNIQGRLNYNGTDVNEYEIFTVEDYIKCLSYLNKNFIQKYLDDLKYLFNYFDERGFKLIFTNMSPSLVLSETNG